MWQRAARFLGQFTADRSGVTALLFGIMLIPLMLGVGIAVDYSRALRVKQHLGRALDVAALAIGSWRDLNDAQLKLKAKAFFAANYDAENLGTPSPLTVNIQENKITISATSTVDMIIMPIAGFNQVTVGALSEITLNEKKIELVMVLDNTGSMGSSGKLNALKAAANTLIDVLMVDNQNAEVNEDVKIGLVPFAAAVNVGSGMLGSGWIDVAAQSSVTSEDFQPGTNVLDLYTQIHNRTWNGCVRARPAPFDTQDTVPTGGDTLWPPYFAPDEPDFTSYYNRYASDDGYGGSENDFDARQRYTGKYTNLTIPSSWTDGPDFNCRIEAVSPLTPIRGDVEAAVNEMVATGNTVIPVGLAWGWRLISPEIPFTEGVSYDDEDTIKAIMLLTDGQNSVGGGIGTHNRSQYNAYGFATSGHLGAINGSEAESVLDAKTATLCANIKNKGIRLYTITFQVSSTSTQDLMRDCATEPEMYFDSPSGAQLDTIFQEIAKGLADLRISK
jgi:Flp pilus assembly protein TadG